MPPLSTVASVAISDWGKRGGRRHLLRSVLTMFEASFAYSSGVRCLFTWLLEIAFQFSCSGVNPDGRSGRRTARQDAKIAPSGRRAI